MRSKTQFFIATITAGFVLAPLSLAWGQVGGNRQIGSPTRDSNAGLGSRSTNSSTRRMNAGTTQQRLGNPLGGSSNFDLGPRRTLFGNSGSAAGNGRPRNTTLNPAAKDPIARNPALLDPVTGIQETGPVQRSGVFDSTGRSFVDPTYVNDAAFADLINPAAAPIGGDTLGIDNIISNPSTANLNRGDELHDFSDSSAAATITDGAADQSGSVNSGPPLTDTFPNAPAVTGSSAGATLGAAANRKMRSDPLLFSRRLLAQRLGLGFDPISQNLTLATVPGGTWADRLGFQPGDRIVAIGGQTVYGYRDLANFLSTHLTGRTNVEVERNGQVEQLPLNLGSLTRRLQISEPTVRLQVTDSAAVTASGRRIAGTAAEAVRAARMRAEQEHLQKSPER